MNIKLLKGIFSLLQWILLVFSAIAIVLTLIAGFNLNIDISSEGF